MLGRVIDFLRVVTSGRVGGEVYEDRLAICEDCTEKKTSGTDIFCGRCGCGSWSMAELTKKLTFKGLRCPIGKFGDPDLPTPKEATVELRGPLKKITRFKPRPCMITVEQRDKFFKRK